MPKPHNFREFFALVDNSTNKTNAKAVCKFCALKNGGIQAAALKSECFTTNKGNLCRGHLAKCENFKEAFNKNKIAEILARSVAEDKRKTLNKGKIFKLYIIDNYYIVIINCFIIKR